jgi:hypothetical protein
MVLVYVTSCNKMLGLLFVLVIILVDNSLENNLYYMENFEPSMVNQNLEINKNLELNNNNNNASKSPIPLEGRDLIGLESNLKKGKQSNSLTVHPSMYESEDVSPNEPDYGFKSSSSLF